MRTLITIVVVSLFVACGTKNVAQGTGSTDSKVNISLEQQLWLMEYASEEEADKVIFIGKPKGNGNITLEAMFTDVVVDLGTRDYHTANTVLTDLHEYWTNATTIERMEVIITWTKN
jgi:hypothetical protein